MEKVCFANTCTRKVSSSCTCGGKTTYSCKRHQAKHTSLPNEHAIIYLLVSLPPEQVPEFLLKIAKALKYIEAVEEAFITQSKKIINNIEENARKFLKLLRDTEKWL